MKLRTFFKTLGATIAITPFTVFSKDVNPAKEPFYRYNQILTTDVLIPLEDGALELNVYGEYCKFIAKAYTEQRPFLIYKFESKLMLLEEFSPKKWNAFYAKCNSFVKKDKWESAHKLDYSTKPYPFKKIEI